MHGDNATNVLSTLPWAGPSLGLILRSNYPSKAGNMQFFGKHVCRISNIHFLSQGEFPALLLLLDLCHGMKKKHIHMAFTLVYSIHTGL